MEKLSQSLEDYLEMIFRLEAAHKVARVRDIAGRLGVKMSSVTSALRHLSRHGLVNYDPYQYITLTGPGRKRARRLDETHAMLKDFLVRILLVNEAKAEENAYRIEHAVDKRVITNMIRFLKYVETDSRRGGRLVSGFRSFCAAAK
jgi:DtxR family Mn-dependent transcriptional regulator